jgi:hypothetical protein
MPQMQDRMADGTERVGEGRMFAALYSAGTHASKSISVRQIVMS